MQGALCIRGAKLRALLIGPILIIVGIYILSVKGTAPVHFVPLVLGIVAIIMGLLMR